VTKPKCNECAIDTTLIYRMKKLGIYQPLRRAASPEPGWVI
jgi:hypothetical protein